MAKTKAGSVYQLKFTLREIEPSVWRRVETADCTLSRLHDIIQDAMGWGDCHLWSFEVGGEQYGDDPEGELEMESARKLKLSQIAAARLKKFSYTYDFGDNWEHIIQIEKVLEADPQAKYPRCVDGGRACPPDDCGGTWGYEDMLNAIKDPKHESHEEMLEWVGGEFDPEEFDVQAADKRLAAKR